MLIEMPILNKSDHIPGMECAKVIVISFKKAKLRYSNTKNE